MTVRAVGLVSLLVQTIGTRSPSSRPSARNSPKAHRRQDAEQADLRQVKTLALSRLVAQHEKIHRLRRSLPAAGLQCGGTERSRRAGPADSGNRQRAAI
jgi:hypothetical protein